RTMLDTYLGGGGARARKDGVDTGGYVGSIYEVAPNAEAYEFQYPILYLFRRHQADSGGGGMFRGGAGCTLSYIVHDTERIPTKIMHTSGSEWTGRRTRSTRPRPRRHVTKRGRAAASARRWSTRA